MLRFKLVENNDKAGKGKSFVLIDIDHWPMTVDVGVVIRLDQSHLSEKWRIYYSHCSQLLRGFYCSEDIVG